MNKKSIHVVHILPTLGFGGAERYVVDLVNNSSSDFRYTIVVFFDRLDLASEITSSRMQIKKVLKTSKLGIGFIFKLQRVLRELQPDIINTHLFAGDFWGRLAAHPLGIPIITTEHNMNNAEGWVKNSLRSILRNFSNEYVACSNFVREYAQKRYGITKPFSVIYPGVVTKRFKHIAPLVLHNPVRLLLLGRLTAQKGQEFALRALAGVKDFSWFLSVVGEGEDKKYLQNLVSELGLNDSVTFLPPIKEVEILYQENDVLLVPSKWEGFGMVAAEALSAGRLVVASAVGGLKEIVEEGRTGFLFKKSDEKSFQSTLNYIYRNKKMATQIALEGKEFVENNFAVEKMVEKYEEIYRRWKK